jgi:hypothetical protein
MYITHLDMYITYLDKVGVVGEVTHAHANTHTHARAHAHSTHTHTHTHTLAHTLTPNWYSDTDAGADDEDVEETTKCTCLTRKLTNLE